MLRIAFALLMSALLPLAASATTPNPRAVLVEAEQLEGILADHGHGQEGHRRAFLGQGVEGGQGDEQPVADAVDVDHRLPGGPVQESAADPGDHRSGCP